MIVLLVRKGKKETKIKGEVVWKKKRSRRTKKPGAEKKQKKAPRSFLETS